MSQTSLRRLIQKSIDLHVHVGPEIIPRKFYLAELIAAEKGKIAGCGIKNHFFPTIAMQSITEATDSTELKIIHSVVLNNYQGGLNVDLIRASAQLSELPIIVWMPTLHTSQFLTQNEEEIPREWLDEPACSNLKLEKTKNIRPINILDEHNNLTSHLKAVLATIKETGAILATGHLSWQESKILVKNAIRDFGIQKIIITHPIYQKIAMPVPKQKKLAALGALIEHCYSMHTIDKIPMGKIADQIKAVGAEHCILSSDVGQKFSPAPSEALYQFSQLLLQEGVMEKELEVMLVKNPNWLLFSK